MSTAKAIPLSRDTVPMAGGKFTFPGTSLTVNRMGYGAMQLAGRGVWGPPKDRDEAIAVLREAVESGVDHIDTSDFYGPHVTNEIIREALHPYREGLVIVTKIGVRRGNDRSWKPALSGDDIREAVEDNLRNLGLEQLPIVNLRVPAHGGIASIEPPFTDLAALKEQGLIGHLGLSGVTPAQIEEAQKISEVVCVQNLYNVVHRDDDALLLQLGSQGIAYVPFFPLGGFKPLQFSELEEIAASVDATARQVALAWLLHRAPNVLLIPGTSSREHLRENLGAAALALSPEVLTKLDSLASTVKWVPPHG